jgi:L-fuculose-phosphate aldolase
MPGLGLACAFCGPGPGREQSVRGGHPIDMIAAQRQVAHIYRTLGGAGMNAGSSGNVSVRTGKGMVITPSGCSADTITDSDPVSMALDGKRRSKREPSSEWFMHAAIYRAYPHACAIVHTHSDACTALACLNEGLPAFHYLIVRFGGNDVRCAPYVTFGTPALAAAAVAALEDRNACLLANHGMIVHAPNAEEALTAACSLETLARQYLLARAAGTVRILTASEMDAARERFKTYGPGKITSTAR